MLYTVWALPISLATTFGIVNYFLFLRVIRWFSSPSSPRTTIDSSYDNAILLALSFLIRTSAVNRSFAAHRGFSQLVTSFFGAMYQGILPTLFVAYSYFTELSSSVAFRQYSLALIKNSRLTFYFFDLAVCICILYTFVLTFNLKIFKVFFAFLYFLFKVILNSLLISLDY